MIVSFPDYLAVCLGLETTLKRKVNLSERSDSPGQICLNVGMDDDEYSDDGFSPLVSVCVRFWIAVIGTLASPCLDHVCILSCSQITPVVL